MIGGLRQPSRGRVVVGDETLLDTGQGLDRPPHPRRVGYVPQDGALFPHLDVRRNVIYGANRSRSGIQSPDRRLDHISATLDIAQLMSRRVRQLSGGERQRVAIARALMPSPRILLLDEPLTGVDRNRRERILPYLLRIRRDLHVPLVYVTHDARELAEIADRVLRLEDGRLVAAGSAASVLGSQHA